jgi:trk system potassium uptake protein TrkA
MFVIIAGGGRTGTQLASMLITQKHTVHVIEYRPDILTRIHKEIPTEFIFEGYAVDTHVLEQAGIKSANVLAACTNSDADNLTICYLARKRYNVPRTIARINDPRNAWLFDKMFHVDVALNQAEVMARLIEEEMSLGDMMTLMKLRRGDYSLVEEKVPAGAHVVGKAIRDLALPESCVIAAIIRHGKVVLPRGITIVEAGDEILAITDRPGVEQLAKLFATTEIDLTKLSP